MTELYTFEEALKALREGKKITRKIYLDKSDRSHDNPRYFKIDTLAPRDWVENDPERWIMEVKENYSQRTAFTLELIEATDWIILED